MTVFLLTWKEGVLFAMLLIFFFTPWSRNLRRYVLLGLLIYLLNKPLIANFHPGDTAWWLGDPAAWITAATWIGAMVAFIRWLQGLKGQGVWSALSEIPWSPHLIAISLIILGLFLLHLLEISPQFKTQADFSFPLVILHVNIQYFTGYYLMKVSAESMKHLIIFVLGASLLFILVISLWFL